MTFEQTQQALYRATNEANQLRVHLETAKADELAAAADLTSADTSDVVSPGFAEAILRRRDFARARIEVLGPRLHLAEAKTADLASDLARLEANAAAYGRRGGSNQ